MRNSLGDEKTMGPESAGGSDPAYFLNPGDTIGLIGIHFRNRCARHKLLSDTPVGNSLSVRAGLTRFQRMGFKRHVAGARGC